MSLGYGGTAVKEYESAEVVRYNYSLYNLNLEDYTGSDFDGIIELDKNFLVKAEIREKRIRTPKGRKKFVTKKIIQDTHMAELLDSGRIHITNNTQCFQKINDYDMIAIRLCFKILNEYQTLDYLPEKVSFDV